MRSLRVVWGGHRLWVWVALLLLSLNLGPTPRAWSADGLVSVPAGEYEIFFREKDQPRGTKAKVDRFFAERLPVTNAQFLSFVQSHPEWRRSQAKPLFIDTGYLSHWKSDLEVETKVLNQPVTHVSWFAARAYCAAKGLRLLTINEWEYVSDSSSESSAKAVLKWYAEPTSALPPVGRGKPNRYGVVDMHGVIWEWVEDFAAVMVKSDSRSDNGRDNQSFCGAGSLSAANPIEYATFMRFAFRSSLKASYTSQNLGFRCGRSGG